MAYQRLRPSQVILDSRNPRLPDGTSTDREAINRLLDDGAEALVALARNMAQTGESNPAELPIAIRSGRKYLVLEGNRRFAALKLLNDPALADSESHQRAFRRAAALGTPPKAVFTLVADSREEADRWIVLRHTGENNGVGVKRWNAEQVATHRRRNNVSVDAGTLRSITIADELETAYSADPQIVDLVRRTRTGKLTNIGRFFSADVMTAVHLTIKVDDTDEVRGRTLWAHHSAEQLRDFFAWALDYILNHSVDKYKNAAIRSEAIRSASHLVPSLADGTDAPRRLADSWRSPVEEPDGSSQTTSDVAPPNSPAPDEASAGSTDTSGHRSAETNTPDVDAAEGLESQRTANRSRPEAKPEQYLLHRLKLPNHPDRVQRLLKECRSLDMEQSSGVACVMLRVIVELSVSSPQALSLSGATEGESLRNKIIKMLKYLDPDIEHPVKRDKQLAQAYLEASELGVQYLNGFVHNPSLYPDPHLARRFSQAFRPFLERVDAEL